MEFHFDLFKNPEQARALEDAYQTYKAPTSTPAAKLDAETKITEIVKKCCIGASWKRNFVDEQEDFIQDVLLQIISKLPTFRGECPFVVWVSRIIQNKGHDLIRTLARRRQKERSLTGASDTLAVSVADQSDQLNAGIDRQRFFASLKPKERELLSMKLVEHFSYREIGGEFGISEGAARDRFHRLQKKLKALWGAEWDKSPRRITSAIRAALMGNPALL